MKHLASHTNVCDIYSQQQQVEIISSRVLRLLCLANLSISTARFLTLFCSTSYIPNFTHLWPARNLCQIYWRYWNPQWRTIKTFDGSLFQVLACIKQCFNRFHTVHTNSRAKDSKPKMKRITKYTQGWKFFFCSLNMPSDHAKQGYCTSNTLENMVYCLKLI